MHTPLSKLDFVAYKPTFTESLQHVDNTHVAGAVYDMLLAMREQRQAFEANVLENWRIYLTDSAYANEDAWTATEIRTQFMLNPNTLMSEAVNANMHNNVSAGKAVEIVEAAAAYLVDALMPTEEWFKYESQSPDSEANAELLTWYLRARNREWQFRLHVSQHVRQACIAGVSVMALPYVNGRVNYGVLDVLNCYWDLSATDTDNSPFIKRSMLTVGEVLDYVESGYFTDIDAADLRQGYGSKDDWVGVANESIELYRGIQDTRKELCKVACYEYWGTLPIHGVGELRNVIVTVVNGKLARIVESEYPQRPYVITPYLPVLGTSFGIGCLQQVRGQAVAADKVLNGLLDGIDVRNLGIFTLLEDEVLRDEDLHMSPGDIIRIRNPNALQRLPSPDVDVNSSLLGLNTLSEIVGRTSGVNSIISAGYARQSERTTATEVNEARNAAGTRMLEVYHVFNEAFLMPYLRKMAWILREFTDVGKEPLVNIRKSGASYWVKMKPGAFEFDSCVAVYGAEHHEKRQRKLDNVVQFLQLSAGIPQFAESINWDAMLKEMVKLMDLPEELVNEQSNKAPQTASPQMPADPSQVLADNVPMQNMLQANQTLDNGASLMSQALGTPPQATQEMLNNVGSV
jgi:hypothetical protein